MALAMFGTGWGTEKARFAHLDILGEDLHGIFRKWSLGGCWHSWIWRLESSIRYQNVFFSFPQFPLRYTYIGYISRLTVGLLHFQFPVQVDRLWTEALVASHTRPTRHNYLTRWVFHGRSARKWILSQLYKKMFGARRCKPCCAMLRCQTILEDEDLSQAWGCGGVKDLAWFRG